MITKYVHEAMCRAKYKILEDGSYYGLIEELPGVWAAASSLEGYREELESVVEGWLLLGLRLGHFIPPLGDVDLNAEVEMVNPR